MEFCGMKREIYRKCLNHARVHANAQSFDRCEPQSLSSTGCRQIRLDTNVVLVLIARHRGIPVRRLKGQKVIIPNL